MTKRYATAVGSMMVVPALLTACATSPDKPAAERTAKKSEGLHEAACATVTPNATGTGRYYDNANIPNTYGSATCPQQWVLQMNNVPAPYGGGTVVASIGPASTVTQADCPNTEASIDFYGSNDGVHWSLLQSSSSYGSWEAQNGIIGAGCTYGQYGVLGLDAGVPVNENFTDYRVVGAMLQHAANKSQAYDSPIAMRAMFESIALQ
jgi:hypothetical protein